MASGVNGKTIAVVTGGGVLMYAGIKGLKISTVTRSLLQGNDPTKLAADNQVIDYGNVGDTTTSKQKAQAYVRKVLGEGKGRAPIVAGAPGTSAAQNQNLARILAAPYGWTGGKEWSDLIALWNQESGWSTTASNPSSGAYGIPQALPYNKMPKAAWPESAGGHSSATAQITWGLRYIKERYGSPSNAWAHEQSVGWY